MIKKQQVKSEQIKIQQTCSLRFVNVFTLVLIAGLNPG